MLHGALFPQSFSFLNLKKPTQAGEGLTSTKLINLGSYLK